MKKRFDPFALITYILAVTIPMVVVLIGLLAASYAPFGSKNVLSAGNCSEYLPYFYELYDRVHEGKSLFFSNTLGNGYDFSSLISYYLSDPTNFLILLFPRNSIISVINILYMFKIGFCSFTMCFFLRKTFNKTVIISEDFYKSDKEKKDFVIGGTGTPKADLIRHFLSIDWFAIGLSCAFAMSSPLVTKGLNITYLNSIAMLPLIIYGINRLIDLSDIKYLVIFTSISIICNMYITSINLIFAFLFFLTRDFNSVEKFINRLIKLFYSMALSFIITGFVVINNINSRLFSEDISINFPLNRLNNPLHLFERFLSRCEVSNLSLLGGNIDIYFGIMFLFLILLYFSNKSINIICKLKNALVLVVILLGTISSTANYFLCGLSIKNIDSYIYLYTFVFFAIYLSYCLFNHIKDTGSLFVFISAIILFASIISSMFISGTSVNKTIIIVSVEFLFLYFICCLLFTNKSLNYMLFKALLGLILLFEIVPNFNNSFVAQGKSFYSHSIDRTQSVIIYEATRIIHSADENARIKYIDSLCQDSTPFTNSLNGYDYIIVNEGIGTLDSTLEYVDTFKMNSKTAGVDIYKNTISLHSSLFDKQISSFKYNEDYPFISANILSEDYLKSDDVFKLSDMEINYAASADGEYTKFFVSPNNPGDIYVKTYSISHLGDIKDEGEYETMQVTPKYFTQSSNYIYQIGLFDKDALNLVKDSVPHSDLGGAINQDVQIQENSYDYVTTDFPLEKSLNYFVDNEKVKATSFLTDNSLVPIKTGSKVITVKYSPKFIILGVIFSVIGLLIFVFENRFKKEWFDKLVKKVSDFLIKNRVYVVSLIIYFFVMMINLMISNSIPFGKASAVAGDGTVIEYADYVARVRAIKAGKIFPYFTFNIGGFKDVYRTYALRFLQFPWLILKYRFLPSSLYLFDFNLEYFLYSIFAVITIIFYLTHRHKFRYATSDSRLIPIAVAYSLCNYALDFYSYKAGFMFVSFLPLIVLGLEHVVYKKHFGLYILSLSMVIIFDPYHAFIFCECLALYFFTMEFQNTKDFIAKGVRFALGSIVTALLDAFVLVPYMMFTMDSPYLSSSSTPSATKFFNSFWKMFSDIRVGFTHFVVANDNSNASLYCGLLIIICTVPLYILCKEISITKKIKNILLLTILFLAFNNEMLNYVFHGFHFQTLVPNRFALFFVFVIVCMFSDVVYNMKTKLKLKELFAISGSFAFFVCVYIFYLKKIDYSIVLTFVFIIVELFTMIVLFIKKNKINIALYVMIAEVIVNSLIVFVKNNGVYGYINVSNEVNYIAEEIPEMKEFYNLTEYLGDNGFVKNLGDMSDINTLTYFSNTYTMEMVNRMAYNKIGYAQNNLRYMGGNPLADMMLHVRYHIENKFDNEAYSIYKKIYSYNNLVVYENEYALPYAFVIEKDIDDNYEGDSFDFQNKLVNELGGDNLYEKLDICRIDEGMDEDLDNYYKVEDTYKYDAVNSNVDSYTEIIIHLNDDYKGKIYAELNNTIYFLGNITDDQHEVYIDYPSVYLKDKNFKPDIAVLKEDSMKELYDILTVSPIENLKEDSHKISGSVSSHTDGKLFISQTYSDGWDIFIDGKKVKKERFLGGTGVPITKGNHEVVMKYHSPGARLGAIISIITVLAVVLSQLLLYRRNIVVQYKDKE